MKSTHFKTTSGKEREAEYMTQAEKKTIFYIADMLETLNNR